MAFDPRLIGTAVVAHHHRRRMIMALDQQARLVPNGNAEWAKRSRHSLVAQPCLGGVDERCRDLGILGLEHPPLAGACAPMALPKLIHLGGTAANTPTQTEQRRVGKE